MRHEHESHQLQVQQLKKLVASKEPPKRSRLTGVKVFWYLALILGVIIIFSLIDFYSATQEITWNDFE
jgi:hypothetical protein